MAQLQKISVEECKCSLPPSLRPSFNATWLSSPSMRPPSGPPPFNRPPSGRPPHSLTPGIDALCTPDGPLALTTEVIGGRAQRVWKHQPRTFRELITTHMPTNAQNAFLSSPVADPEPFYGREYLSHGEAYERAIELAGVLRDQGVGPGTRVAIGGTNCTG